MTNRDAFVNALAQIFDSRASARRLLEEAGIPSVRLPPFGTMAPIDYWRSVVRELDRGLVTDGIAQLKGAAARSYPANPLFQEAEPADTEAAAAPQAPADTEAPSSTHRISAGRDLHAHQIGDNNIIAGGNVHLSQPAPAADVPPPRSAKDQAPQKSAVLLTALPVEYDAVLEILGGEVEEVVHPKGTIYELAQLEGWRIALAEIGAGNEGAAYETTRAIDYFDAEVALFVGIAGGLKDVRLGDVVASTKVYGYERSTATQEGLLPRFEIGLADYALEQRARFVARRGTWKERLPGAVGETLGETPRALVGPIAAGEKVVMSEQSETARFLRRYCSDALAVEMEGRGFLAAVRAGGNAQGLVVRGIASLLDSGAATDPLDSPKMASQHAAAFAVEVLAKIR